MKNILVVGSVNLDYGINSPKFPLVGETINGSGFTKKIGGKGFNQFVASSKYNEDTRMIGSVGGDAEGKIIIDYMKEHDLSSEYIEVNHHSPTGVALILRSESDNMIVIDQGANRYVSSRRVEEYFKVSKPEFIILQLEIPLDEVEAIIKLSCKENVKVVLNPAPALNLSHELWNKIDFLILNQAECEFYTDIYPENYEDVIKASKVLLDKGVVNVIITMGKQGAVHCDDKEIIKVSAFEIDVVDTTGAGDAFVGTFTAAITEGLSTKESLVVANAAGALTCLKVGASEAMPTKKEIQEFLEENKK